MAEPMTDLDELGRGVSNALDAYRVERDKRLRDNGAVNRSRFLIVVL